MRFWPTFVAVLAALLCLLTSAANALDREALTFTSYRLEVTVDATKGTLGATGTIQLRNDSAIPQSNIALQISSSLSWTSITLGDSAVPFITQNYTSDIDHTGALSEAIVTLPEAVDPKRSITLRVAYSGTVPKAATRLARIGTPEDLALASDWDYIGNGTAAVRSIGFANWIPVALPSVNLSDGSSVFESLANWRDRHSQTPVDITFRTVLPRSSGPRLSLQLNAHSASCSAPADMLCTTAAFVGFHDVPTFGVGTYELLERPGVNVWFLPDHTAAARDHAAALERAQPLVTEWFGQQKQKVELIDLLETNAAPFESSSFLFKPLRSADPKSLEIALAHQVVHASFSSPRPWISEGLAHFMQVLTLERLAGRKAALDYLSQFNRQLVAAERSRANTPPGSRTANAGAQTNVLKPLVSTQDPILYRAKAAAVWFMLRDMLGEDALRAAIQAYKPEQDTEPSYVQRLLEKSASNGVPARNLEWFFDDWVYRDRGLPDFRIASAYGRKTLNGTYVVTITVENVGTAGAEVAVSAASASGERSTRVLVQAGSKAVARVAIPETPIRATVNDGGVPESDTSNNSFTIVSSGSQ